jgi:hypothetical protein
VIFINYSLSILEGNFYQTTAMIEVNGNRQIVFAEYVTFPRPLYCSFEVTCAKERAHALRISVTRNMCQAWDQFFFFFHVRL